MSKHTLEYGMRARQFDTSDFQDQSVTRILKKLSIIERAALPENELKEVSDKGTEQERVSLAIALCENTSFSQNLRNTTGQPSSALKKVIAWYLLHKAKILVFGVSHPKVAYPRLLWCLDIWVTMAHCLLTPGPLVLTPWCLRWGPT